MRRKEEDITWIEIKDGCSWIKVIFIEELPDGDCYFVHKEDQNNYMNYQNYKSVIIRKGIWRHIKEPTYRPYQKLTEELMGGLLGAFVRMKGLKTRAIITEVSNHYVSINSIEYNLCDLFKSFEHLNGSPIGEEVTE